MSYALARLRVARRGGLLSFHSHHGLPRLQKGGGGKAHAQANVGEDETMTIEEMLKRATERPHTSWAEERGGEYMARPLWAIAALLALYLQRQGVVLPESSKAIESSPADTNSHEVRKARGAM